METEQPKSENNSTNSAASSASDSETSAASAPSASPSSPLSPAGGASSSPLNALFLEAQVIEMLRTCYDPEIPVNIYELGLIYEVAVSPDCAVHINMTLTSPQCPVAGTLPPEVERKIRSIPGVKEAKVSLVWEPTWTQDKMSEAAKLELGIL